MPSVGLTGWQAGIRTEPLHGKARIARIDTERIQRELKEGHVVIVAGFQGVTEQGEITTLGRGGSDTTAMELAAAAGADLCEIYTEVDSVYTTDPRVVKQAQKIERISFDEMLELAPLGAAVLHPRAVECAKKYGVRLMVRSSFTDAPGVAAQMFAALADSGITIGLVSTTEITVTCVVAAELAHRAVQVLHETFGLNGAEEAIVSGRNG